MLDRLHERFRGLRREMSEEEIAFVWIGRGAERESFLFEVSIAGWDRYQVG